MIVSDIFKDTIFCASDVFEKISSISEFRKTEYSYILAFKGIEFVEDPALGNGQCFTNDPALIEASKALAE